MKNKIFLLFLIFIFLFSLRTAGEPFKVCMEHLGIINSFDEESKGDKIRFAGIIEDYGEEIKIVKELVCVRTRTGGVDFIKSSRQENSGVKEMNFATIIINDSNISFKTQPEIRNGRTMIPINKDLIEVLGISYKENKMMIILTKGNGQDMMVIKLKLKSKIMKKNDKNFKILASPYKKNGKVLVPLRPILEALGYGVSYDAENKQILAKVIGSV